VIPLRLVLDTNIVVSAALVPEGVPRTVLTLALNRPARLYISPLILSEYRTVFARRELKIRSGLRQKLLQLITKRAHTVRPARSPRITSDPDDNIFLECADAARADYLVTGNLRHFPRHWKTTKIVSAREFVDIVGPHLLQ
jgi:putative PIN family toxin of toxin-antitoxin system